MTPPYTLPHFSNVIYYNGYILCFTEWGEVWEFSYNTMANGPQWRFICDGPQGGFECESGSARATHAGTPGPSRGWLARLQERLKRIMGHGRNRKTKD